MSPLNGDERPGSEPADPASSPGLTAEQKLAAIQKVLDRWEYRPPRSLLEQLHDVLDAPDV